MTNETMLTLQGWIGNHPTARTVGGTTVTSFRLACTPRRYQRQRDEWVDDETQWYTVSAWRALGEHCERSLHKGDPVIVYGRLTHRTYVNKAEVESVALEVDAVTIGHDLSRGRSQFMKAPPRDAASTANATAADAFASSPALETSREDAA